MKRMGWVLMLSLWAPTLHALDVSYGSFLKIVGIMRDKGQLSMPVERKKYHNIRIGNKDTYQWVSSCKEPCILPVPSVAPTIQDMRSAQTRSDMWIVTLDFNRDWFITFLVFHRGEQYSVKAPTGLQFLDKTLKKQTEEIIISTIRQQAL